MKLESNVDFAVEDYPYFVRVYFENSNYDKSQRADYEVPTFKGFLDYVLNGKIHEGGLILSRLFHIHPRRATRCALHFSQKFLDSPVIVILAMKMRYHLQQKQVKEVYQLLNKCFGLELLEAAHVARHLTY